MEYGGNLRLGADIGQSLGTSLRSSAVFFDFFASGGFLFGLEFLYPTELIDKAHLTGEEGVTLGADVDSKISLGGASLESSTT